MAFAADPVLEARGGDGLSLCPEWVGAHLPLPVSFVGRILPVSVFGLAFTLGESIKFGEVESGLLEVRLVPTMGSEGEDAMLSKCTDPEGAG
jgi:hypothetical protein